MAFIVPVGLCLRICLLIIFRVKVNMLGDSVRITEACAPVFVCCVVLGYVGRCKAEFCNRRRAMKGGL